MNKPLVLVCALIMFLAAGGAVAFQDPYGWMSPHLNPDVYKSASGGTKSWTAKLAPKPQPPGSKYASRSLPPKPQPPGSKYAHADKKPRYVARHYRPAQQAAAHANRHAGKARNSLGRHALRTRSASAGRVRAHAGRRGRHRTNIDYSEGSTFGPSLTNAAMGAGLNVIQTAAVSSIRDQKVLPPARFLGAGFEGANPFSIPFFSVGDKIADKLWENKDPCYYIKFSFVESSGINSEQFNREQRALCYTYLARDDFDGYLGAAHQSLTKVQQTVAWPFN